MEVGTYRSNSTETEWWVGFEKFPLFEHSEKKEKKSGGKKKNTKKPPWLMMALTILWMMFCMIGMFTISATQLEEELPIQNNRKIKTARWMEWPAEELQDKQDTWSRRRMAHPGVHLASDTWNPSAHKNQEPFSSRK